MPITGLLPIITHLLAEFRRIKLGLTRGLERIEAVEQQRAQEVMVNKVPD